MKRALNCFAALAAAAALSACIEIDISDLEDGIVSPPPAPVTSNEDQRFNQTMTFNRATGTTGTLTQTVLSGRSTPGIARVCFRNNGPTTASLVHSVAGINPL